MDPDRIKCPNCGNRYTAEQWTTEEGKLTCPNCGNSYSSEELTHAVRDTTMLVVAGIVVIAAIFIFMF